MKKYNIFSELLAKFTIAPTIISPPISFSALEFLFIY